MLKREMMAKANVERLRDTSAKLTLLYVCMWVIISAKRLALWAVCSFQVLQFNFSHKVQSPVFDEGCVNASDANPVIQKKRWRRSDDR